VRRGMAYLKSRGEERRGEERKGEEELVSIMLCFPLDESCQLTLEILHPCYDFSAWDPYENFKSSIQISLASNNICVFFHLCLPLG
jgi:hypothetical protein